MNIELPDTVISHKISSFLESLKKLNWEFSPATSEKTIDTLFDSAMELEELCFSEEKFSLRKYLDNNSDFNSFKPVELLLHIIIRNQNINENITLYAIEKYIVFYSKEEVTKLLDKILSEIDLRKHLHDLIEAYPDVDLDLLKLNNFLCDILKSSNIQSKILNELKSQTCVYLKALKQSELFCGQFLVDETIFCLELQTDLRLWFTLMKDEHLETIVDLAVMYSKFLKAVLKFFDKFADEIESNYDEELNIQYSHVNLDFEDFVKVFQMFLNEKRIANELNAYLKSKTINDKNFCFWIDVKSCL